MHNFFQEKTEEQNLSVDEQIGLLFEDLVAKDAPGLEHLWGFHDVDDIVDKDSEENFEICLADLSDSCFD